MQFTFPLLLQREHGGAPHEWLRQAGRWRTPAPA
jgi:hypothetical protein